MAFLWLIHVGYELLTKWDDTPSWAVAAGRAGSHQEEVVQTII